jgi:predicted alpha/beta superfamily hydrolase
MNRSGIDRTYRTKPDCESTSIGGSSLGGLIAMHACLEEPEPLRHIYQMITNHFLRTLPPGPKP